jgi:hypothetical protein
MHTIRKEFFLPLLIFMVSITQKGICDTFQEMLKTKTLVVVVPDEEEKIFSNMMDAVEEHWKYGPFKFMNVQDAKELFSNKDYIFLQIVTLSTSYNATSGALNLSLKQGATNSKKDINRLMPLRSWPLRTKEADIICSMDHVPIEATQRMYFFTSDFINSMETTGFMQAAKEGNVTYTCAKDQIQNKKDIISKKNVLLIDKNDISPTDSVDRTPILRQNLNIPELKVVIVDFEEIDLALRKKENNTMVAVNGQVYTCNNFEVLCQTPIYDVKELKKQKKHQSSLKVWGWVIAIVVLGGSIAISEL